MTGIFVSQSTSDELCALRHPECTHYTELYQRLSFVFLQGSWMYPDTKGLFSTQTRMQTRTDAAVWTGAQSSCKGTGDIQDKIKCYHGQTKRFTKCTGCQPSSLETFWKYGWVHQGHMSWARICGSVSAWRFVARITYSFSDFAEFSHLCARPGGFGTEKKNKANLCIISLFYTKY